MADKDRDSGEEEEHTIEDDVVVTKYKMAADMANAILKKIVAECRSGASARAISQLGDKMVLEETAKVYKKDKEMAKGIGFPVCISINNVVCHFSPLLSEEDMILAEGDMVKIDMGIHVDGFIAGLAHTIVVGASKEAKVTGRKADVLMAAYYAAEIAQRLVKPGNSNQDVTDAVNKVAEEFNCKPVEGMLSHQLQQNVIDGEKTIIQNPTEAQRKDHSKIEFEANEVYGVDVLISTGDGKARDGTMRTTVFKKTDETYSLKLKASRVFYSEVSKQFTMMPFTLRAFEDEKKARLGVVECESHHLLVPYPVLMEKEGEFVAQFKYTLLLMPNGPSRITQGPWNPEFVQSEHSIKDEGLKKILASQVSKKSAKKKKKKAAAQAQSDITEATTPSTEAVPTLETLTVEERPAIVEAAA